MILIWQNYCCFIIYPYKWRKSMDVKLPISIETRKMKLKHQGYFSKWRIPNKYKVKVCASKNTKSYASYPSHLEATSTKTSSAHCKERLLISCLSNASRSFAAGAGSLMWKSNLPKFMKSKSLPVIKMKIKY